MTTDRNLFIGRIRMKNREGSMSVIRLFLVLGLGLTGFLMSMPVQGRNIIGWQLNLKIEKRKSRIPQEIPRNFPNSEWCNGSKIFEDLEYRFGSNLPAALSACRKGRLTDERLVELSRPGYCFQEMTYENLKFYFDEGWFEALRACDYGRIHIESVLFSLQDSHGKSPRGYCNKGGATFEEMKTHFGNNWFLALVYCKDDTYFMRYFKDHLIEIHDYCRNKVIYESLKVSYGEEDWLKALVCGKNLQCNQDQTQEIDHILKGDIDSLYSRLSIKFFGETAGYPSYIHPPILLHQNACEFEQVLRESTGQKQRPTPWLDFTKVNSIGI